MGYPGSCGPRPSGSRATCRRQAEGCPRRRAGRALSHTESPPGLHLGWNVLGSAPYGRRAGTWVIATLTPPESAVNAAAASPWLGIRAGLTPTSEEGATRASPTRRRSGGGQRVCCSSRRDAPARVENPYARAFVMGGGLSPAHRRGRAPTLSVIGRNPA